MLVQHVGLLEGGDGDPAVEPWGLQIQVELVLGVVDQKKAVNEVALDVGEAVLGRPQVLHALLDLLAAEAGTEQDGDEHGHRGEEDWVTGNEMAKPGETRP